MFAEIRKLIKYRSTRRLVWSAVSTEQANSDVSNEEGRKGSLYMSGYARLELRFPAQQFGNFLITVNSL